GHAYVYLIYGMHHCLNAVTGRDGVASAVLLRAIAPGAGIAAGVRTDGPGRLTKALGISRAQDRADLCSGPLFLRDGGPTAARARRARPAPAARASASTPPARGRTSRTASGCAATRPSAGRETDASSHPVRVTGPSAHCARSPRRRTSPQMTERDRPTVVF